MNFAYDESLVEQSFELWSVRHHWRTYEMLEMRAEL